MSSDRRPVWLDEEAHLLLKQYAKLVKTSMTEVTSRLVLDRLDELDGAAPPEVVEASTPATKPAAEVAPAEAEPVASAPNRYVETDADTRLEPPRPAPPAPPRRQRTPREETDEVRYLGGVWLV